MARRLKIAQLITRLDRGGASDMVVALCERLDRARFEVTLITGPSADPVEEPRHLAERLDITVAECPDLRRDIRPGQDLRALFALRRYLRDLRPDIVHAHTSKAGALGRMAAHVAGAAVVYSPHGHLFYGYYGRLGTGLVLLAERVLAPLADVIAVLTDRSRGEHLDRAIGCHDQFVTVPSGVDLERFCVDDTARAATREKLGLADRFLVGWVGRLTAVKAPDTFIAAAARAAPRLPAAAFVVVGDGELRAEAEEQAKTLGLGGRCVFLGQRDDVPALLNACDAFVLSSRNEGLGLAVVEAAACGTPVVATDVGGVREVLQDGRAGLLVPADRADTLADAVLALAGDDGLRRRLVRAGLDRAEQFSVAVMVDQYAHLYEELVP